MIKKLFILFIVIASVGKQAKAQTIKSVCNGKWSSPNTWNTGVIPTSTDTIMIYNNVILDVNVTLIYPYKLIIDSIGSVCGSNNFTGGFLAHGFLSVDTLEINSYSINYVWLSSVQLTVDSVYSDSGGSCVGCLPTCGLPLPCHTIATYTYNIPVNDTLNGVYVGGDTLSSACYPNYSQNVFVNHSAFPYASGVKLYFLIATIDAPASTVSTIPGGIIHIGDTLPLPTTNPAGGYQFYFSQGGNVQLYLIALGTPNSPGQTYVCGWDSIVQTYKGCQDSIIFYPDTTNTCNVRMMTTSINSKIINTNISIYPNPNNGSFVIETNATTKQTIMVYDVTGKLVLTQTINGKTTIDASTLNEGAYNININSSEGVINKKVVIIK